MFSAFFAAHAVLQTATAGGPSGHDLFRPSSIAIETACLLVSSFTCGLSAVAARVRSQIGHRSGCWPRAFSAWRSCCWSRVTLPGWSPLRRGPQRSAFLSSFFAVVGLHGLHVSAGLLWLGTMMAQLLAKGFRPNVQRRLLCFDLFWHALDIIWVALFTIVYLIGEGR